MSVSFDLYSALKSFDDFRREQRTEFLRHKANLERFKGSEGYKKDMETVTAKRKREVDDARKTASLKIDECLKKMRDNINRMAIVPPTAEQVAILQVLSLKTKVSKTELDRAAQAMKGNAFALSALNDIADKHYFVGSGEGNNHTNYNLLADDLSEQALKNYIGNIVSACKDRLQTGATRTAFQGAMLQKQMHNIDFDEDTLPQKAEMTNERDFYSGVINNAHVDSFLKAVNG